MARQDCLPFASNRWLGGGCKPVAREFGGVPLACSGVRVCGWSRQMLRYFLMVWWSQLTMRPPARVRGPPTSVRQEGWRTTSSNLDSRVFGRVTTFVGRVGACRQCLSWSSWWVEGVQGWTENSPRRQRSDQRQLPPSSIVIGIQHLRYSRSRSKLPDHRRHQPQHVLLCWS